MIAAFNRVATYRKRGKNGFLGCVDMGEKSKQNTDTNGLTTNTLEKQQKPPKQPQNTI